MFRDLEANRVIWRMRVGLDWNQIFRKDTVATISSTVYVCKQKKMKYKVCIKVSDDEDTVMNNNDVMVDHHYYIWLILRILCYRKWTY